MPTTSWIALAMMIAFIGLGFFYVWLRHEVLQPPDEDDAGPPKKP